MELVDLEAAAVRTDPPEKQEPGEHQHDRDVGPKNMTNRCSSSDNSNNAGDTRLYDVARAIVEEVLQTLPDLLHRQLRDTDDRLVGLDTTSVEDHTVPGASEGHRHTGKGPRAKPDELSSKLELQGGSVQGQVQKDHTVISYKTKIKPMGRDEIKEERDLRKSARSNWQGKAGWKHLEDPWKNLTRYNKPQFDPSFDEQRKNLQLELMDAILSVTGQPRLDKYFRRGLPAVSCWIGLIGLRLVDLNVDSGPAFRFISVLIEFIWVCRSSQSARMCDVLESCFKRRVLHQPCFDDTADAAQSTSLIKAYLNMVRIAIYLLDLIHKHGDPRIEYDESMIDDAWTLSITETEEDMRVVSQDIETDPGKGPFYKVSDFGLKHLQEIGQVEIQWTDSWDEHLQLKTRGPLTILKLYWFSPTLARFFQITRLSGGSAANSYVDRGEEIARTLDLVLNPSGSSQSPEKEYKKLKAPRWLGVFVHSSAQEPNPRLSRFCPSESDPLKFCCEIEDHMVSPYRASPEVERITYSEFPHYYQRLRDLRNYMDWRKPRGLLALWRDRRDSNTYYTFWLVVLFGCCGVMLGAATLAIAILQAWGQLQSLHQRS
ncbi:MAG: hypothetical protein Q9204_004375 [Flavoplaca sp. TL-2023a]